MIKYNNNLMWYIICIKIVEYFKNNYYFFRKVLFDFNFDCFGVYNYDF